MFRKAQDLIPATLATFGGLSIAAVTADEANNFFSPEVLAGEGIRWTMSGCAHPDHPLPRACSRSLKLALAQVDASASVDGVVK